MRFIEVEEIPNKTEAKPTVQYHKTGKELEEFINMNVKYVRVIFGENDYKSLHVAHVTLDKATRYHGYPIKTVVRGTDLYLMRTDI